MAEIHVRDFTLSFQAMQKRHADEVLAATCEIARDWEQFARERDQHYAADQNAAEDLLAEAQERLEQKDKQIAALEQKLAVAEEQADAFAEEADGLEAERDGLEERLACVRWGRWLANLVLLAGLATCIAGVCGAFK